MKVKTCEENLHILCAPLIGNLTGSSCGLEHMNTYGLSDSPLG